MPDLIISFTPKLIFTVEWLRPGYAFPWSATSLEWAQHFSESLGFPRYIQSLYRMAMRRAQFVAFHNQDDLQYFSWARSLIQSNQGVHIPALVSTPKGICTGTQDWKCPSFLFIGRILPEKGSSFFWKQLCQLHSIYPEVQWKVVGYPGKPGSRPHRSVQWMFCHQHRKIYR